MVWTHLETVWGRSEWGKDRITDCWLVQAHLIISVVNSECWIPTPQHNWYVILARMTIRGQLWCSHLRYFVFCLRQGLWPGLALHQVACCNWLSSRGPLPSDSHVAITGNHCHLHHHNWFFIRVLEFELRSSRQSQCFVDWANTPSAPLPILLGWRNSFAPVFQNCAWANT